MMGYDNENDQVDDEARKEKERVETDLRRVSLGDRDLSGNGRMNRGRAVFVKDEILEKKKKKDESEQREAIKRAQEALDRHLEELQRQIEAIKRQIAEAKKDILDAEEQLRKKYGDNWEEKFRRGEADKNDRLYKDWLQKHERLNELEKRREELETRVETLKHDWSKARTPEEKQAVVEDAKAATLWETRTWEDTKGPKTSGLTLSESANPLQDKMKEGEDILDKTRTAKTDSLASSGFLAANMEGDGTYTKGIGEKGLTSQIAFNNASSITQEEGNRLKIETAIENNETLPAKAAPNLTG